MLFIDKNKAISSLIDPSTNEVLASTAGPTGAITHRADNHYHPVLEIAGDSGNSILPLSDTLLASII
jgi:hypothetical protein